MLPEPQLVGRYAIFGPIATGGMATVSFGRALGGQGFDRVLAVKRLHPQFAADPDFVEMFLDEARLAARVRHLNVVSALDVVEGAGQVALVLEYVPGETLMRLVRRAGALGRPVPLDVAAAIGVGVLDGLHAAHEARAVDGTPLGIVHRDVSPHNVLVGADGIARLLDFGVAKASQRSGATREGHIKGKLSYMPPEQLARGTVDRRSDLYSAAVTLWEAVTGRRLFHGETQAVVLGKVLLGKVERPSQYRPDVPPALEALLLDALQPEPEARPATAHDMARRLEAAVDVAPPHRVARWVEELCGETLAERAAAAAAVERAPLLGASAAPGPPSGSFSSAPPSLALMNSAGTYMQPLVTPTAPAPAAGAGRGWRVGGALLLAAFASGWWFAGRAPANVANAPGAPAAAAPSAPAERGAARTGASPDVAPPAVGPASAPGVASAKGPSTPGGNAAGAGPQAKAPAPPVARPPVGVARRGPPPKAAAEGEAAGAAGKGEPRPGPTADCQVPYRIDESGLRQLKPECL